MSTEIQTTERPLPVSCKTLFERDDVKKKFDRLLNKNSSAFITSVLQIVASNNLLAKCDPVSIYQAAITAATLNLQISNAFGFAYIIPYNQKFQDAKGNWKKKQVAQFQLGFKGYIQLAQRTGQFKSLSSSAIYEGQLKGEDPLRGYEFDFKVKKSDKVIGYAAYFQLVNGFEKTLYMTVEDIRKHAQRYSKNYGSENSLWKTDFDAMANKTVIKLLLSKFAPLSIDMQKAYGFDEQGDAVDSDYEDIDIAVDTDKMRVTQLIENAETVEELEAVALEVEADQVDLFNQKKEELKTK